MIQNIQTLFASIRLEEIKTYLTARGWSLHEGAGRVDFRKELDSGETRVLFLPDSEQHPKFRRLVPNVVFTLAVLEQREALVIANEIVKVLATASEQPSASKMQSNGSSSQIPKVDRDAPLHSSATSSVPWEKKGERGQSQTSESPYVPLRIKNGPGEIHDVSVSSAQGDFVHTVGPEEEILVTCENHLSPLTVELRGRLAIDLRQASLPSLLLTIPIAKGSSIQEWLSDQLACRDDGSSKLAERESEGARASLNRFRFLTTSIGENAPGRETILRSVAQLASELSHLWEPHDRFAEILFQLVQRVVAEWNIVFRLEPRLPNQLWEISRSEHSSEPFETYRWMLSKTVQIPNFVSTPPDRS